jgi:hypothetical protein
MDLLCRLRLPVALAMALTLMACAANAPTETSVFDTLARANAVEQRTTSTAGARFPFRVATLRRPSAACAWHGGCNIPYHLNSPRERPTHRARVVQRQCSDSPIDTVLVQRLAPGLIWRHTICFGADSSCSRP